jgi:hypothetical protein
MIGGQRVQAQVMDIWSDQSVVGVGYWVLGRRVRSDEICFKNKQQ